MSIKDSIERKVYQFLREEYDIDVDIEVSRDPGFFSTDICVTILPENKVVAKVRDNLIAVAGDEAVDVVLRSLGGETRNKLLEVVSKFNGSLIATDKVDSIKVFYNPFKISPEVLKKMMRIVSAIEI
jgi:hypothetical protein